MKILLTIHHPLDPNAGAPGTVLKLGQVYQSLGHEVHYLSHDNLPKHMPGIFFPEFAAAYLHQHNRQHQFDVIDASTGDAWVWGKFLHNKSSNYPLLVTHSHGLEHIAHLAILEEARLGKLNLSWKYPLYWGGFHLWEVATSLRCADCVFMLNQQDAEYVIEELHIQPERVHVVANGIPTDFLNLPLDLTPSLSSATISIAQVGTYISRKGIHYSTPALNEILLQHQHVTVSFLGTGCSKDLIYADFDPTLRDRIQVVSSYPHDQLPNLLKNHQILLFPSLSEGFPLVLPESMACGLASIVTNIPGPTEIVTHGENGIVIPARSTQAISQSLTYLIQDRSELERLRRNAYATAQQYAWSNIAQKRLTKYKEALEKKKLSI